MFLAVKILFPCANFVREARPGVAQICNLLYRRIAFGGPSYFPDAFDLAAASGLQIRDTAEYNSALLRLRLGHAKLSCGKSNPRHPCQPQFQSSRSLVPAGGATLRPCRIARRDPKRPNPNQGRRVLIRSMPINSRTGAAGTWPPAQPCPGFATGNRI